MTAQKLTANLHQQTLARTTFSRKVLVNLRAVRLQQSGTRLSESQQNALSNPIEVVIYLA
jgi:hypothetical protein